MGVARGAIQGVGYAPEMSMVIFPTPLFMVGSDLTPISERIDEFTYGLAKWEPETKEKGVMTPSMVTVEGKDYEEAAANMNKQFLMNLWGDGLPIPPPTEESVSWILTGTDLPPDTEVGRIMPRGGIATVETIAVALAMTGGRPEYLPVLIATVEAICIPECGLQNWQTGSSNAYPVVVVNGPIGQQIRLNSGFGLVGPHPQYPAGGAIGRALRFLLHVVGGAIPGIGAVGQYCLMRYINAVFAEDEAYFPEGWETLNTEYFGHPKGTNAVTTIVCAGIYNVHRRGSGIEPSLEVEQLESLYRVADSIKFTPKGKPGTAPAGLFILNSLAAGQMASIGWTKETIKQKLWELTSCPLSELLNRPDIVRDSKVDLTTLPNPVPLWDKPERLLLAVAGGRHPTSSLWLPASGFYSPAIGGAEIKLPANWDELIKASEEELGPIVTW